MYTTVVICSIVFAHATNIQYMCNFCASDGAVTQSPNEYHTYPKSEVKLLQWNHADSDDFVAFSLAVHKVPNLDYQIVVLAAARKAIGPRGKSDRNTVSEFKSRRGSTPPNLIFKVGKNTEHFFI